MQKLTLFLIISTEFCERFCYYGLRALLFPFLHNHLSYSVSAAKGLSHAFFFLAFFFAMIFGFFSDVRVGHYRTIVSLSIVHVLGTGMLVISAYTSSTLSFLSGILLVAMGTGGIKPCISVFGGDQANKNSNFFSLFYFSINCGAMVSILTLPIIAHTNYTIAFIVPFVLISMAVVLFVSGTRMYTINRPDPRMYKELKAFLFKKKRKSFYVGHGYGFCQDLCEVAENNEENSNFNEVVGAHRMGDVLETNGSSFNEVVGSHRTGGVLMMNGRDRTYSKDEHQKDVHTGVYEIDVDMKDRAAILKRYEMIHRDGHLPRHAASCETEERMGRDAMYTGRDYIYTHDVCHPSSGTPDQTISAAPVDDSFYGERPSYDTASDDSAHVHGINSYSCDENSNELSYDVEQENINRYATAEHFSNSVMNDSNSFNAMDFSSLDDAFLHGGTGKEGTSPSVWIDYAGHKTKPKDVRVYGETNLSVADARTYSADKTITLDHSRSAEYLRKEHKSAIKKECRQILQICRLYLPIIFFWTIYDQQATSWTDQASFLNGNVLGWTIIPSQMQVFNALLTLIFIPLFSHFVFLKARTKMVAGFYLGAVSFFLSAVVEHYKEPSLTVMVQLPQYVLMTAGEVLLSVTGLEYSYSMAPKRFRSVVLAIWLFMAAIGNVLVAFISRMNFFKAEIGSYLFYGCLAVVGSRWLNYEFRRISK